MNDDELVGLLSDPYGYEIAFDYCLERCIPMPCPLTEIPRQISYGVASFSGRIWYSDRSYTFYGFRYPGSGNRNRSLSTSNLGAYRCRGCSGRLPSSYSCIRDEHD